MYIYIQGHDVEACYFRSILRKLEAILESNLRVRPRGGGLGSRPKKMYGERLGNGVEYHLMSPTPRR